MNYDKKNFVDMIDSFENIGIACLVGLSHFSLTTEDLIPGFSRCMSRFISTCGQLQSLYISKFQSPYAVADSRFLFEGYRAKETIGF